jgi:hypothetical protein
MTEKGRTEKTELPSPIDTSPNALMERFEKRQRWRESPEGQEVAGRARAEKIIKQEQKINDGNTRRRFLEEESRGTEESDMSRLAEAILRLEERLAGGEKINKEMLEAQKQQLEMWVGGGYDALVSAEGAQMAIDPRLFETEPPAWYRNLSEKWQEVIRARIAILMGCYHKRARGHFDLAAMVENTDIRIDRDALDIMWREMPGFRIAVATITEDIFEITREIPPGLPNKEENAVYLMVLKREAIKILENFADYKKKLTTLLEDYFKINPQLLEVEGSPQFSPRTAARAAVATAWNLFFVGNAVDSGDQGDLSKIEEIQKKFRLSDEDLRNNPTVGRKVRNPIVYAEQARAMMLPFDKAWGKTFRSEDRIGTEETWLGNLGDYIAERNRHDSRFREEFFKRKRRIVPQRLFASWFDLTSFEEKKEGISLGRKLCEGKKRKLEINGLWDFINPEEVDFRKLSSSELWGGYADVWDSARKIYEMIGGKNPLKIENVALWRQTLATSLSKLRGTVLAPYFKDSQILVACIAGSIGLTQFTNEYLLTLPEDEYDVLLNLALNDDRLFKNMEGNRKMILGLLNANDHYSFGGLVGSLFHFRRTSIRQEAALNARRVAANI